MLHQTSHRAATTQAPQRVQKEGLKLTARRHLKKMEGKVRLPSQKKPTCQQARRRRKIAKRIKMAKEAAQTTARTVMSYI